MLINEKTNRILWVDWLKALSIIGVVILHVSNEYFICEEVFLKPTFFIGLAFKLIAIWAVPIFIMSSGFLILRKNETIQNTPKRIKRILIPFVFWVFVNVVYLYFFKYGNSDILGFILYYLNGLLNAGDINVYWFCYMILGLYLLAPCVSKWINNSKVKEIEYFLGIWVIVMLINFIQIITGYHTMLYDYLIYFSGGIGLFIFGYYLSVKKSKYLKSVKFGLLLFILGYSMMYIETLILSRVPTVGRGCYDPNTLLQAIGIYIIVKNIDLSKIPDKINEIIILLSSGTYGAYLVHMIVLGVLRRNSFTPIFSLHIIPSLTGLETAIIIPITSIIVLVVTYMIIIVMSKIPVLREFSGFKLAKKKYEKFK